MEIAFRVRDVEVPESLRCVTRDRVTRLARRCGIERAVVCFSAERNPRIAEREVCQITLFGPRRILQVHASATDVTVAVGRVVAKLEQRADRLRGQTRRQRYPRWCAGAVVPIAAGDGWVHFPANRSTARREPGAVDLIVGVAHETGVPEIGAPGTGGTPGHPGACLPMTPEDAALELADTDGGIFFFVNVETGRPAAVYHRRDGAIALCDSAGAAEVAS